MLLSAVCILLVVARQFPDMTVVVSQVVFQVVAEAALLQRRVLFFYFQALFLSKSERAKRRLSSELCKHGTWFSDLPLFSRALLRASPSRASLLSLASASLSFF